MSVHPLETYLKSLRDIRSTGQAVEETSYYPALTVLLNELGKSLKPKVFSILHVKNRGAGIPDGGIFTQDQLQRGKKAPDEGTTPARGVIEIKPTKDDAFVTATGKQVTKYWNRYRQVLVTNYRDFVLVSSDSDGTMTRGESYRLSESEDEFWDLTKHPRAALEKHGVPFIEFLNRVLLHGAPLSDPKDVAWFLASYARHALARIEHSELKALAGVRAGLEQALGVRFEGAKGDHFFKSTFIQTLFYGIFSAWVLWNKDGSAKRRKAFNWHEAAWTLRVPMIKALFDQVATPSKLGPLGLVEPLDWSGSTLNRVEPEFFDRFEEGHAVQYFYEPFLEAFDPALRKELGVWYTPPEIVRYMVARVDSALREELDLPDGLADKRVFVLDPCCGTGAFLVEVVRKIAETLRAKGGDALIGQDLKLAATKRVFGFEILPAPFVVAHLQMGLLLRAQDAPLSDKKNERVGVYLTNALTGWKPPEEPKTRLLFPEMEEEREAADNLKQHVPILVILGNPPYNGFAGLAVDEERELSKSYRTTVSAPKPQGQGLNDLYVRFFRMAERRIVEMNKPSQGLVCFISNYSWLDGLSFTGMRERYLDAFDKVWIDCLNGDKYKTGKLTPYGKPDPSVFSTEFNREGIQVGTAVALLTRKEKHKPTNGVAFRHFWGKAKLAELETAAKAAKQYGYEKLVPELATGLPFIPSKSEAGYLKWPLLPELFPLSFPGVKTSRDDFLVDIDRERLLERVRRYFNPKESNEDLERLYPGLLKDSGQYKAKEAREFLVKRGVEPGKIVRYCYRPFDLRWLYWEPDTFLLDRKRDEYIPHVFEGNYWLEARQRQPKESFDRGYFVRVLSDNFGNGLSNYFPLELSGPHLKSDDLFSGPPKTGKVPNLSDESTAYLKKLKAIEPEALFFHSLVVMHAPAYRKENAGALRQDWPRVPLPTDKKMLIASAALGREVAAMLDPETPTPGVSAGTIRPELKALGVASRIGKGRLDPEAGHLGLTVGWGHSNQDGACMPGRGKVVFRDYSADEFDALCSGTETLGMTKDEARELLGKTTVDVYLNGNAYWRNIPEKVWGYTLGGYQVIKKWLSYREKTLLGRDLSIEEARYVTEMVRRIAAILLLEPKLNSNYQAVKADCGNWSEPPIGSAK